MKNSLKRNFYAGLITILPLIITFYVFNWLLNIVLKLISGTIITKGIRKVVVLIFKEHSYGIEFQALVYLVSILIMLFFITLLGYTMKLVFFSKIIKKIMNLFEKIPVIKTVYTTTKQIIDMLHLTGDEESAYKKVVYIEYPRKGVYAIGFLMSDSNSIFKNIIKDKEIANVFIPTSPNPTSGMLICIPKEEAYPLDISVEMAFKLIISGGYITEDVMKAVEQNDKEV